MKPKIEWDKWDDPLNHLHVSHGYDEEDDDDTDNNNESKFNKRGRVMLGPLGALQIDRGALASNKTVFWEGNTNFNISKKVLEAIQNVEGVETLRIVTRYRFIISFGKAFNEKQVMKNIENLFDEPIKETVEVDTLGVLKKQLASKFAHWVICILPNKKMISFGSNDQKEVFNKINECKSQGCEKIYTCWD